jgi:quinol monooxygenase YgiN
MRSWLTRLLGVAAALTATHSFTPAYAQPAQLQYVVVYGELAPRSSVLRQAQPLLSHLADLAKQATGSIYFAVNAEVERPNFFSLVEIWQDATSYAAFTGATNTQQVIQYLKPLLIAPLDERDGNLVQ